MKKTIAIIALSLAPLGMRACEPVESGALPTGVVTQRNYGEKVGGHQRVEICVKAESNQGDGKFKKGKEYCHGDFKPDAVANCAPGKYWPGCYGKEK